MSELVTIMVAVKHVPVGGAHLRIDGDGLTREGVSHGLDPLNEVGLEWAVRAREAGAAERVVAVCMGAPDAVDTLRRALAVGADGAVLITDDRLRGAEIRATAGALAAAARRTGAAIVVTGYESLDGSSGAVPAAVAALLDWPLLSRLGDGRLDGRSLRGTRDLGWGPEAVKVDLPVVVSMVEGQVAPRYPKLKDVILTKNAQPTILSAADLDLPAPGPGETVLRLVPTPQPAKQPRIVGLDAGIGELADLLTDAVRRVRDGGQHAPTGGWGSGG